MSRVRGDQSVGSQRSGEELDQDGEHLPIRPVQARFQVLAGQDRVLVTKNQDLDIFGRTGPSEVVIPRRDLARGPAILIKKDL